MARYTNQLCTFCDGIIKNDGHDVVETIAPPPRGDATQRFRIYTDGYRIRLQKAVEADYPCLKHYLGEQVLHVLIADYVEQTPSKHFNLDRYPIIFNSFVYQHSTDQVAKEISLLESTIASVFMMEDSIPLDASYFSSLAPEEFGRMLLRPRKASRLLQFEHLANSYLTEFRAGEMLQSPEPLPQYLYVYRHQNTVQRYELPHAAFLLLQCLFDGHAVEQALEKVTSGHEELTETIAANVQAWFQEWISKGFFATSS